MAASHSNEVLQPRSLTVVDVGDLMRHAVGGIPLDSIILQLQQLVQKCHHSLSIGFNIVAFGVGISDTSVFSNSCIPGWSAILMIVGGPVLCVGALVNKNVKAGEIEEDYVTGGRESICARCVWDSADGCHVLPQKQRHLRKEYKLLHW